MHLFVILTFQYIIMHSIKFVLVVRNKHIFTWIHNHYNLTGKRRASPNKLLNIILLEIGEHWPRKYFYIFFYIHYPGCSVRYWTWTKWHRQRILPNTDSLSVTGDLVFL